MPLNAEVGLDGVVMEPPAPEMILQAPVPTVGTFPASEVEVPQTVWLAPALDAVGLALAVMTTSFWESAQTPFKSVHLKVLAPIVNPDTVEVGLVGLANVPVPPTTVHVPPPVVGVFPAKVAEVAQIVWSGPAFDVVFWCTVTVTATLELSHPVVGL